MNTRTSMSVLAMCLIALVTGEIDSETSALNITTEVDQEYSLMNEHNFDVTSKSSLTFKVKSCDHAIIRFLPEGLEKGDVGFKFRLNKIQDGNIVAVGRLCSVNENGNLDCEPKQFVEMESSLCDDFKTFWVHFDEDEKDTAKFGEGCTIGDNAMYSIKAASPFHWGDVVIASDAEASWVIGNICDVDELQTVEPPTAEPPTAEPPISEPPTAEPPISESTTSESTTSEPPASESTTSEPSTSEPTTSEPTSSEPTTSEPTTSEALTSEAPTSEPPTAEPPTSELSMPESTMPMQTDEIDASYNNSGSEGGNTDGLNNNNDGSNNNNNDGSNNNDDGSNNNEGSNNNVGSNGSDNSGPNNNETGETTLSNPDSNGGSNNGGDSENGGSDEGSGGIGTTEDESRDWSSLLDGFLDNSSPSVGSSTLVLLLTVTTSILKLFM